MLRVRTYRVLKWIGHWKVRERQCVLNSSLVTNPYSYHTCNLEVCIRVALPNLNANQNFSNYCVTRNRPTSPSCWYAWIHWVCVSLLTGNLMHEHKRSIGEGVILLLPNQVAKCAVLVSIRGASFSTCSPWRLFCCHSTVAWWKGCTVAFLSTCIRLRMRCCWSNLSVCNRTCPPPFCPKLHCICKLHVKTMR